MLWRIFSHMFNEEVMKREGEKAIQRLVRLSAELGQRLTGQGGEQERVTS